jgi:wyosine [tRNA(Phe)-imidazoG37] synthetase (radical SAM superfamily)
MTIPLQKSIIYGPVNSRRLGRSLGINVLPIDQKICSFNCLYCQYGWTSIHVLEMKNLDVWPKISEVLENIEEALTNMTLKPSYITFSGNGEPTLHPDFPQLVDGVIELRNRCSQNSKTAILSNSTTISDSKVWEAISRLDVKIMKLDCGSEQCLKRYNVPCKGINFTEIVSGLKLLKEVTIQALITGGPSGNYREDYLEAWLDLLAEINPVLVQIYSLDRGYPSERILPIDQKELFVLKDRLLHKNINAEVYQ